MPSYAYIEDQFVEQSAIGLFALGWTTASALEEVFAAALTLDPQPSNRLSHAPRL
jgi:hypothetical protein